MNIDANILPYWSRALYLFSENPERLSDYANSFSQTQHDSKIWLLKELLPRIPTRPKVMIIGGWYGTYLLPILLNIEPNIIIFNDIDKFCVDIVKQTYNDVNIHFNTLDMNQNKDYMSSFDVDVIINTSCEHMNDMTDLYSTNPDCIYAFQSSSNNDDPGHINVSKDSDELISKSGITQVLYAGNIELRKGKVRSMVIGLKH